MSQWVCAPVKLDLWSHMFFRYSYIALRLHFRLRCSPLTSHTPASPPASQHGTGHCLSARQGPATPACIASCRPLSPRLAAAPHTAGAPPNL
jgi:hypothetical protein